MMLYAVLAPLVVSALIYTVSYVGRDTEFVSGLADQAQDRYAAIHASAVRPTAGAKPIVFLHYDAATFSALSDPVFVPPTTLATTLRRLAKTPPWAVLVDIDVSHVRNAEDLAALSGGLEALADAGVAVFLARPTLSYSTAGHARYRPTPLDTLVERRDDITWVSVAFEQSKDGVVRTLKPLVTGFVGPRCAVFPSTPLALRLLADAGSAGTAKAAFARGVRSVRCTQVDTGTLTFAADPLHPRDVGPTDGDIEFAFEWRPASGPQRLGPNAGRAQVLSMPVGPLLASNTTLAPQTFQDALVIIGRTAGREDFHQTPLGDMPGALILANAARAWLDVGPVDRSFWPGLLLVLAATLCISGLSWAIHKAVGDRPVRWFVKKLLPGALLSGLWLLFYVSANPLVSAGLVFSAFIMLTSVELGHEHVERLEKLRKGSGR